MLQVLRESGHGIYNGRMHAFTVLNLCSTSMANEDAAFSPFGWHLTKISTRVQKWYTGPKFNFGPVYQEHVTYIRYTMHSFFICDKASAREQLALMASRESALRRLINAP